MKARPLTWVIRRQRRVQWRRRRASTKLNLSSHPLPASAKRLPVVSAFLSRPHPFPGFLFLVGDSPLVEIGENTVRYPIKVEDQILTCFATELRPVNDCSCNI